MAKAKHMVLLVFSDNELYDNNSDKPIDPNHYMFEEDMSMKSRHPDPNIIVCYTGMKPENKASNEQDVLMLKLFCEKTNGKFICP